MMKSPAIAGLFVKKIRKYIMVRSYIFSGLKRRQFSLIFLFSLLFAFMIAAGTLLLLINKLIFELGFNGHKDAWLMPVILGTTFVVSILVSQLQQVIFFKTKTMMGFNQAVQLKFGDEMVDIQIVISPILASSTSTDKMQFLAFTEFLFEDILVQQFEQKSSNTILAGITALFVDENLIEYKYVFDRKREAF